MVASSMMVTVVASHDVVMVEAIPRALWSVMFELMSSSVCPAILKESSGHEIGVVPLVVCQLP